MHEDYPPQPIPPPYAEPRPYPARPPVSSLPPSYRLGWMIWVLLLLVTFLILPMMVERIEFALVRGRERAEAEVAGEQLGNGHPFTIGDYRYIAKKIAPSVVGVKASRVVRGQPADELYSMFGQRPMYREQDQGSGVIVDAAGYIITNNHVVDRAGEVTVQRNDGSHYKARVVGADPATDLAVLKISASDLTAADWGDSETLEVGDPVLAVGNPFGLDRTVTAGIISAKNRRAVIEHVNYQDFLQTDAAVNPGNSGGPLVNSKGQVVGINTAIVGPTYQGISFAIPSSLAQRVYEQLRTEGKVARGWLGVSMQRVTPDLAEKLELKGTGGALVSKVLPGSPAAEAGLEAGDVIVRWNDKAVNDPGELGLVVASTKIGSTARVVVVRDGREKTFTLTVAQRPENLQ